MRPVEGSGIGAGIRGGGVLCHMGEAGLGMALDLRLGGISVVVAGNLRARGNEASVANIVGNVVRIVLPRERLKDGEPVVAPARLFRAAFARTV